MIKKNKKTIKDKKDKKTIKDKKDKKKYKTLKSKKIEQDRDNTECNVDVVNQRKLNKTSHTKNGNKQMHYKILQINSSNANFCSKLRELKVTININMAQIIIISESNAEIDDNEKMPLHT